MQYQAPNFDFIALAAQQAGTGIKEYAKEKKKEEDYNFSKKETKQAYQMVYDQSVERYMKETGETDPYKAGKFVASYYMPPMSSEKGKDVLTRLLSVEPKFEAALKQKKVQIYQEKTAEPGQYQRPETIGKAEVPVQRTGLEAQRVPEQMGSPAPGQTGSQYQSSARSVGQMQEATLNEAQAPGTTQGPSMPSSERMGLAERLGVTEEKPVTGNIQRAQDVEAGQEYSQGQNRAGFLAAQAAQGRDVTQGATAAIADATPTEKDIMTNDRLKDQEKQRAELRALEHALKEKKLKLEAAKQTSTEDYKLLDAQINLLNTQIKASEGLAKRAMGIKTGSDPLTGTYTFTTNEELDDLYRDNKSTLLSANELYTRVNKKNEPIIPPMKPIKSKIKIISVEDIK
jgi:hypothetical protein